MKHFQQYYYPKPFTFHELDKKGNIIDVKLIGFEIRQKLGNWKSERDNEFKRLLDLGFRNPFGEPKERI